MKDMISLFIQEVQQFRKDIREDMAELREVNQNILQFMGESREDRKSLHKAVDLHEERIQKLEQAKKKDSRLPIRFTGF